MDWTLDEAVSLTRALQSKAKEFGYHVCLGGGTLNNGISYKDVDLYFLPFENPAINGGLAEPHKLVDYLTDCWGQPTFIQNSAQALEPKDEPNMKAPNLKAEYRQYINPAPAQEAFWRGLNAEPGPPNVNAAPQPPPPEVVVRAWRQHPADIVGKVKEKYWGVQGVGKAAALEANRPDKFFGHIDIRPPAVYEAPEAKPVASCYRHKMKFYRNKTERIDVFILGGD